jgi:ABC-type transport system involved in multi-copper enzyme maturation permease subunit
MATRFSGLSGTAVVVSRARGEQELVATMNLFQVPIGLLFISVSAATSLAEESAHGSLDVLLATPLSSRSISAGKWFGSFRQVTHVLIWPAITTSFLTVQSGKWISYIFFLALIVAYAAVSTSAGLVIATRVRRVGRAVALCAALYIAFSVGWPVGVATFVARSAASEAVMIGSPLAGTVLRTHCRYRHDWVKAVTSGPGTRICELRRPLSDS